MIDKEKIRKEVETVLSRRLNRLRGEWFELEEEVEDMVNELLSIIFPAPQELVNENLEEAANDYAHDLVHDDVFETFIAGAQWRKEQMITKACTFLETYPHMFMGVLRSEMIEDFKKYLEKLD